LRWSTWNGWPGREGAVSAGLGRSFPCRGFRRIDREALRRRPAGSGEPTMLKLLIFQLVGVIGLTAAFGAFQDAEPCAAKVGKDCCWKGHKLYGKIKIVDSFPDIRVQVVDSFADLRVQRVDSFADRCGRRQFVDSFPDLKIKFVDSFPDIKIKFVDSFPGLP
jgi:hypothetical protein